MKENGTEDLVSVLLPAYNVEDYIGRCIESVMNQTYKNIEIIIVDDCSPDHSGEIAEKYARIDSRVKVIHHERNLGLSESRNTGIEHATGQFITFVDSDDWVEKDYVAYLIKIIDTTGADIAISRNFFTSRFRKQISKDCISTITPEDMLCDIFYNRIHVGVWNRLYKKSLLNGKWFRLKSKTGEGMQYNTQVIPEAHNIGVGLRRIYTYNVDNNTSATKKPNIEKQAYGSVETMDYIKENLKPRNERLNNAVEYQYFTTAIYALEHLVRCNEIEQNKDFYKKLYKYCRFIAPLTFKMEISKKQMLKSILVWFSPYIAVKAAIMWRYHLGIKQRV